MTLSPWLYPVLFTGGVAAGWIDSIAGGGGLVTIPLLLWVGLPAQMVLGTNKFQSSFGSFTAALHYTRRGVVSLHDALPGILFTLVGAALGSIAVQLVSGAVLNGMIPFLLLGIAVYLLFTPSLGRKSADPKFSRITFYMLFGILLGFYDGFFGPGTGSFLIFVFIRFFGLDFLRASSAAKIVNVATNAAALLYFGAHGQVLWTVAALMAVFNISGAVFGAHLALRHGSGFVRKVFLGVASALIAKFAYDTFT